MLLKKSVVAVFAAALIATVAFAQQPATPPEGGTPTYIRPETPEQRRARLGTAEDPGVDPDPAKHYWRFGKGYHIERFERRWAAYDQEDPNYVRPFAMVNSAKEIYQQNDKYVWVWMADPPPPEEVKAETDAPRTPYTKGALDFLASIRPDFTELTPADSKKVVRFEESSTGLPDEGSWRNSLDVADMNGDGCPDIIAPPERTGNGAPAIFLGNCKGQWAYWKEVEWPHQIDYGSVAAADFNRDGHMDLAFGVHLRGVYVWLGDGKGHFREVGKGLPTEFATRRIVVTDVDGDRAPDVVAISEGPTSRGEVSGAKIRAFLNRNKAERWEQVDIADPEKRGVGGDWLAAGDFNGDGRPDFSGASVYFNSRDILYLSSGPKKWKLFESEGRTIPSLSYYFANGTAKISSRKRDDLILSYVHFWPTDLDPRVVPKPQFEKVVNIDRVSFPGGKLTRDPIMRWSAGDSGSGVWGLAVADFDGDGNADIIVTRFDPRDVVLLLGDGKGGFTRATAAGLTLEKGTNYDVKVADVNRDGRPDVILMYEAGATTSLSPKTGSIRVFLNRGLQR